MIYTLLLYSWRFSRYSASFHWLVHGHMTSNNETVSRQMPWAGNIAKTMTSNGKQFTVTCEMLTAVARDRWNLSAVFKFCFCFVLLYNKSLNDWSLGEQWILFSSNLKVSLDFVSGNIAILGKQNSLFPSGPVIKCLVLAASFPYPHKCKSQRHDITLKICTCWSHLWWPPLHTKHQHQLDHHSCTPHLWVQRLQQCLAGNC